MLRDLKDRKNTFGDGQFCHVTIQFLKQHTGQFTSPIMVANGAEYPVEIWNSTHTIVATTLSGDCRMDSNIAAQNVRADCVDVWKTIDSSKYSREALAKDDDNEDTLVNLLFNFCHFVRREKGSATMPRAIIVSLYLFKCPQPYQIHSVKIYRSPYSDATSK